MKNYIGCKIIKAELSNFKQYKLKKYGETAKIEDGDEKIKCYIVIYPPIGNGSKPYISMSPKEVFEKAYRQIDDSEISLIISGDL